MARTFTGTVVSTKMNNTIVIELERKFRHKVYKKVLTKHKKMHAHCEKTGIAVGDTVRVQETKPISKLKHFIVIEKLNRNK